jgi:hypothetical protein
MLEAVVPVTARLVGTEGGWVSGETVTAAWAVLVPALFEAVSV